MESAYITSALKAEQLPAFPWPEVAFIGRSNVGKSSLLNALLNRRDLARTSSTPGRTQMVNFFYLQQGEERLILADLPGYGYSAIGREARQHWESLIKAYVLRPTIGAYLFLIDARRAARPEPEDLQLIRYLESLAGPDKVTLVLTKADKLGQGELAKHITQFRSVLTETRLATARIVPVSTLKKKGIEELRRDILALMPQAAAKTGTPKTQDR